MSRSRRHAPFVGHATTPSDKLWKQQHARRLSRAVHQLLGESADGDVVPVSRYALGHAGCEGLKDGQAANRPAVAEGLARK